MRRGKKGVLRERGMGVRSVFGRICSSLLDRNFRRLTHNDESCSILRRILFVCIRYFLQGEGDRMEDRRIKSAEDNTGKSRARFRVYQRMRFLLVESRSGAVASRGVVCFAREVFLRETSSSFAQRGETAKIARSAPLERRHDSIVLLMRSTANGRVTTFRSWESPWEPRTLGTKCGMRRESSLKFEASFLSPICWMSRCV